MNNIKSMRKNLSLTLQDVADAVGSTKPHIWAIENGKSKNPTISLAYKISSLFGVSVYDVWPENKYIEGNSTLNK